MNKHRAMRMIKEDRMTKAGLEALEGTLGHGAKVHKGEIMHTQPWKVSADILKALKRDPQTWKNFQKFPLPYKRIRVGWIDAVRYRKEVFKQRLGYFLKMTAKNKKFGMIQE
jgi:hypothetical protein